MAKTVEFKLGTEKTTNKVTRRQCDYLRDLAERNKQNVIPTERQLLDYCTTDQMSYAIDNIKRGATVKFI